MFIQEYVANKDELNQKTQEYTVLNYKMEMVGQDFTMLKKRNIGKSATIILIIISIIFFPIGLIISLIYWYTREVYEVRIEVNPERAGETVPLIPDMNVTPLSSLNNNNNDTSSTSTSNDNGSYAEPVNENVNAEPTDNVTTSEPVDAEIVSSDNSVCSSCGTKLSPEDKFCVECGTKVE